jgi:serine/threonine-protein kinase
MVRPGDRLGERYVVIQEMAAGGMGTLWRARHVELEVDVALKVISSRASSPASSKRFKREAQAAAKLRSPNIVQVLDYGEFEGQPFLAMELLKGEDLATRIARAGRLRFDEVARILDGMAKGVQHAHDAGIVHRDLKPGNVFIEKVGQEEVVKILDFGIAKDLAAVPDPASTTGVGVVGSPAYMSPEQVWAKKVGYRTDVWSMGVVVFEMLTGENPFLDDTLAKIFERIIRDPLPKVRDREPALPESLDAFFERALARTADERFGSAKELAEAFHAAIEGRELPPPARLDPNATTARAQSASEAAETVRRRDRVARSGRGRAVVAALVLALAGGMAWLFRPKSEPPATAPPAPSTPSTQDALLPPEPSPRQPEAAPVSTQLPATTAWSPAPKRSAEPARPRPIPNAPAPPSGVPVATPAASSPAAVPSTPAPASRDPRFGIPVSH